MKRYALLLLALPGLALGLDFGKLSIERGYQGPLVVDVEWSAGNARDITGATGTLTVYSTPPVAGVGGTVLFSCSLAPVGSPTYRMACTLTTANTTPPGSFYARIAVLEGNAIDVVHGTVEIAGR